MGRSCACTYRAFAICAKKACTPRKNNVAAKKHHRSSLQTPKRTYIIVCTCAAPCVPEKTHHGCCWEKLQRAHMSRNRQRPHAAHKHAPQPKKRHHSSRTNSFNAAMNSFCPHVAPGVQKRAPSVVGVLVRHALAEQRHMRKKKSLHAAQKQRHSQEPPPQQPCKHP